MNAFKKGVLSHIEMVLDTYKPHYKKLNRDQKLEFDLLKKCSELLMQNEMSKTAEGKAKTLRKI
jgi:hypothetical protein